MNIYFSALALFLVMDPVGNIPIFLSLLRKLPRKRRFYIIIRELFFALILLLLFLLFGNHIMSIMQITRPALSISGGVILAFVAVKMIFTATNIQSFDLMKNHEPFLVPLAIPLIAGPGALAIVVLWTASDPLNTASYFYSVVLAWAATAVILITSDFLREIISKKLLNALEKLMGMILITISVQMILDGITMYLKSL